MSRDRGVRSSQLITPFGPGAIVDIGDESLLMTDIKGWPGKLIDVRLPRLAAELGVTSLKSPPKKKDRGETPPHESIKTIRFPRWMFCQQCRRMEKWNSHDGKTWEDKPACRNPTCKERALVPMRFVMACDNGHMDDVPWDYWAHSGKDGNRSCDRQKDRLSFKSQPQKGSGLDALYVECGSCSSRRDLGDISSPEAFANLKVRCTAAQPWEPYRLGECELSPVALQRGASNLYFPVVRSALDIPVAAALAGDSDLLAAVSTHMYFENCKSMLSDPEKLKLARGLAEVIAEDNNCTVDEVILAIQPEGQQEPRVKRIPAEEDLKEAEWQVLVSPDIEDFVSKTFVARVEADLANYDRWGLAPLLERVVLLDKLREVRAFCGYERAGRNQLIPPAGAHEDIKWLPAIEVFGEGIFLQFSRSAVDEWMTRSRDFIEPRLAGITQNYNERNISYLPEPTMELVALHTLSHLLIRQLSFECGYSSGSIRERIYAAEDQVGILIYTADSDSEGSLGGLVQQGEASRLLPTLAAALDTASWCSNDPVCSEMQTQGVMGLNKAACHSCTLVSETSCTMNNLMLDRKLLIGDGAGEGLFTRALEKIKSDTGGHS